MGLAALGLLGQPAAWAVDTSAFEAKAAKYRAEREKRELTKPVVTSSVETPRPAWPASLNAAQAAARPRPAEQLGAALGAMPERSRGPVEARGSQSQNRTEQPEARCLNAAEAGRMCWPKAAPRRLLT